MCVYVCICIYPGHWMKPTRSDDAVSLSGRLDAVRHQYYVYIHRMQRRMMRIVLTIEFNNYNTFNCVYGVPLIVGPRR